jgi:hypothetical protein
MRDKIVHIDKEVQEEVVQQLLKISIRMESPNFVKDVDEFGETKV